MARKNRTVVEKRQGYFIFKYEATGYSAVHDLTEKTGRVIQECSPRNELCLEPGLVRAVGTIKRGSSPTVRKGSVIRAPAYARATAPGFPRLECIENNSARDH